MASTPPSQLVKKALDHDMANVMQHINTWLSIVWEDDQSQRLITQYEELSKLVSEVDVINTDFKALREEAKNLENRSSKEVYELALRGKRCIENLLQLVYELEQEIMLHQLHDNEDIINLLDAAQCIPKSDSLKAAVNKLQQVVNLLE